MSIMIYEYINEIYEITATIQKLDTLIIEMTCLCTCFSLHSQ